MKIVLILVLCVHVLPAVFWTGATFVQARSGAAGGEHVLARQLGGATVAMIAGVVLWGLLHTGGFGPMETVLAAGAVAAVLAAGVQGAMGGPAARRLRAEPADVEARGRLARAQRIAAVLLAIALVCMVTARYA